MPNLGSHDDETIAARRPPGVGGQTHPVDERYLALRARVDEVEAKLERHDLLLARLIELGRGIS
jgi:hypothetical protein